MDVTLPRLGETMEEAEILVWLKAVGDRVERGEPLVEVQTDKIAVEVPALQAGVLGEILAEPGQAVKVGSPIARIDVAALAEGKDGGRELEEPAAAKGPDTASDTAPDRAAHAEAPHPAGKVRASPAARKLARELGMDLNELRGTGPGGRITTADLRVVTTQAETLTLLASSPLPESEDLQPLSRLERATGRATSQAFHDMPHVYVRVKVDATELSRRLHVLRGGGAHVTVNDALVLACARVLKAHPRLNASYQDEALRFHREVNIGVITATPEGLVTLVVPRAETLSLQEVHRQATSARSRLLAGRTKAEDVSGATFCISNLGMYGVEEFSAIIFPPNVATLAVGAIKEDVIVADGAMRTGKSLRLTLSADHRALDGVHAALFLADLQALLESPASLERGHG